MELKIKTNNPGNLSPALKIAISGIVMSIYVVVMFYARNFAFLQYQIRIATSLYSLSAIYPFLIVPLGISNLLSNTLLGGLGLFDIFGGLFVGIITSSGSYLIKKIGLNDWFIAVPLIFGPGLIVPIWLQYILHVPYLALAASLCIGQILPGIAGVFLIKQLRKAVGHINLH